ncbi:MAG: hypothetical protein JSV37_05675 [Anaerolineaceae bacterium]|nr:MAG: hypothetical protein JSV37_05675 [Anaerolineaceae bacterium]
MFGFDQQVLLRLMGIGFALMGLGARVGAWKKWYWGTRGGAYAYLPIGMMFILFTYNAYFQESLGPYYFLYWVAIILVALLILWWAARPPAFVKPRWVRWVEKYPPHVIKAMAAEVEEGEAWEENITSEDAVDQWAKRVKGKPPKKKQKRK